MSLAVLVVVAFAATLAADAGRLTTGGLSQRQLSQTLANPTCPVGCVTGKCERDTSLGYVCTACQSPLLTSAADGRCGCTAGKYSAGGLDCTPCDKGFYCPGGTFTVDAMTGNLTGPPRIECGPGLTTVGRRSTALKACVNMPGTFYSVDSTGQPSSTPCAADTYSTGNRKQRACVPCPPGHTTNGVTAALSKVHCLVKEGYFLKAGGFASPCPKGEYKTGLGPDEVCQKCPPGTSTLSMESTSAADCKVVLPGMYPSRMETENGTYILETQKCPQKFVCAGGVPTVAFIPTANGPAPSVEGTTVQICPYGTYTEGLGAASFDQCLTPPGYRTVISGGTGYTEPCRNGEYRSAWKPAVAASSCTSCGDNIYSEPDDQITLFAITPDAKRSMLDVRASDAACYVNAGQGIYYSGSTKTYYAKNCDVDSYGAAPRGTVPACKHHCLLCSLPAIGGLHAMLHQCFNAQFKWLVAPASASGLFFR